MLFFSKRTEPAPPQDIVRLITDADVPTLYRLTRLIFGPKTDPPQKLRRFVWQSDAGALGLWRDGKLAAYLLYETELGRQGRHCVILEMGERQPGLVASVIKELVGMYAPCGVPIYTDVSERDLHAQMALKKSGFRAFKVCKEEDEDRYLFVFHPTPDAAIVA
jgi:hypothetical protein